MNISKRHPACGERSRTLYGWQRRTICATVLAVCFVFTWQATAEDIVIDVNAAWSAGTYDYNNVLVTNNAVLTFSGAVSLNAQTLTIDSGASISAGGTGFAAGLATLTTIG
jgi:hypothetical protein